MSGRQVARRATQALLRRTGKTYDVDPDVPAALLWHELTSRGVQLGRGLLRMRSRSFVGRGVRVRGKRSLVLGPGATLGESVRVDAHGAWGVTLGRRAKLGAHSVVTTTSHLSRFGLGLRVGDDTGIGEHAHLGCSGGVVIGRDVIVGPYFSVHSQEHVFDDPDVPIREQGTTESSVVLGDDIWVGARVTVLAGSRIGSGSVIAAGAVVRGEFPPFSLIAGVPAKRLRGIRGSD